MKTRTHFVKENIYRLSREVVEVEAILPHGVAYVVCDGKRYAIRVDCLEELDANPLAPCYCCGMSPTTVRKLDDTYMIVDLCAQCVDVEFRRAESKMGVFRFLWCLEHGQNNHDRELYTLALGQFREKFGVDKRMPPTRWNVNWTKKLDELRNEWRDRDGS